MQKNNLYFIIEEAFVPKKQPIIIKDEKVGDNKYKLIFKTVLQEADVVNKNKRIYSKEILRDIVNQLSEKASRRELLGELDHPWVNTKDQDILKRRAVQVRLSEACVLIRDIQFDGKYVIAECETLTTQKGLDLYALLKDNINIGFSLRAFGPLMPNNDGTLSVGSPIKAVTYDVVSNPSHSNARILEFLSEDTKLLTNPLDNNVELLTEDIMNVDSASSNDIPIILPIGTIINDLDKDEVEQLKNGNNIDVKTFSVYLDSTKNIARICNNNVCIEKPLDDLMKVIIGKRRLGLQPNRGDRCEYYPLVGFGRAIKFSLIKPDEYKPIINTTFSPLSNLENNKQTQTTIIDSDIQLSLDDIINSLFEDQIDLLEELLSDKYNDFIDQYLTTIYKISSPDNFEKEFFEDALEEFIEEQEEDTIEESTINLEDNDYIDDDEFEYSIKHDLHESLDYFSEEVLEYIENIENPDYIIEAFKQNYEEIINELNAIPSVLFELSLEDSKYINENRLENLLNDKNINETQINHLLEHLLYEYYNETKNILTDVLNKDINENYLDTIFYETLYFDDFEVV